MSSDLSLEGRLEEASVPELIRGILKAGDSASITADRDGVEAAIYLKEGKIVFATSSDPDLGLAEVFLRAGNIGLAEYQQAHAEAGGGDTGAALVRLGSIGADDLMRGVETRVRRIIMEIFAWSSGTYMISFGEDFPPGMVSLNLSTDRLVLDGIGSIDRWSRLQRGIRDVDTPVRRRPEQDSRLYTLELTEEESSVYDLCEAPFSVRELCGMSYMSDFATVRALWALLCINLLEEIRPSTGEEGEVGSHLLELVENFNGAYTAFYRVVFQRIGEEIQDFTIRLIDGLPPESGRRFRGMNLNEGGRVDAARLEANLQAEKIGDISLAAHESLNELLYQWVLQARQDFGTEVEREITDALNSMSQT